MEDFFAQISNSTANFNSLDWIIVTVVILSMCFGLWRGFAREAMSLVGWVAAFVAANLLARPLADALLAISDSPTFRYLFGWGLIFVAVIAIVSAVGGWLSRQMKQPGFNLGNRLLGACFGVLRGLVIMMAVTLVLKGLLPDSEEDWLEEAELMPPIEAMADWFSENFDDLLDVQPADGLGKDLSEQLNASKLL